MRTAPPSSRHVWIRGYWGWEGGRHVWIGGRWELPPAPGRVWVEPRWVMEGGEWALYQGHWGRRAPRLRLRPCLRRRAHRQRSPSRIGRRRPVASEGVPRQPGNGYIWVPGDWIWDGRAVPMGAGPLGSPTAGMGVGAAALAARRRSYAVAARPLGATVGRGEIRLTQPACTRPGTWRRGRAPHRRTASEVVW